MAKKSKKKREREESHEGNARLAFIGTLAAGLAHEIRSPLNAIALNLELMQEDLEKIPVNERKTFGKHLKIASTEVAWLKQFLDEFLNFARPPQLTLFPTRLSDLLDDVIELIRPELDKRQITIHRDYGPEEFPVMIDRNQFGHGVILNLLTNAMEAIGEVGDIHLITRVVGERNDVIQVSVEDNAGGVDPEVGEQVFDLFYSTKPHGTGLGLGIARRIMAEHGGTLTLENVPGVKAIFHARLPQAKILQHQPVQP
ncbi:MAG TPA: ATP-binding protein [Planctomycetota bacterium]|nr:ATP-binding protein [Planctomycetota bacterium]